MAQGFSLKMRFFERKHNELDCFPTLYQITLSKHFIQALFQGNSKSILDVPVKVLQRYCKGITKALQRNYEGITEVLQRYYDKNHKIVNNSLSNIFVQLTYRGEVLRSITCFPLD